MKHPIKISRRGIVYCNRAIIGWTVKEIIGFGIINTRSLKTLEELKCK